MSVVPRCRLSRLSLPCATFVPSKVFGSNHVEPHAASETRASGLQERGAMSYASFTPRDGARSPGAVGAGAGRRVRPLAGACEPSGGVVLSRRALRARIESAPHSRGNRPEAKGNPVRATTTRQGGLGSPLRWISRLQAIICQKRRPRRQPESRRTAGRHRPVSPSTRRGYRSRRPVPGRGRRCDRRVRWSTAGAQ